jgi:D-alanyl-D-alanine carboxypeptidase/D-alanyl-D-alanine-endopeptidase (penicillin-binding protein 4)
MPLIYVEDNAVARSVPIIANVTLARFALIFTFILSRGVFGDVRSEVAKIVAHADLNNGIASVCIIDTQSGNTVVEINAQKSMIPASNQKLFTTGAALHVLGPQFTFQTSLLSNGNSLIVVGDGDPTFGDSDLAGVKDWSTERQMLESELKPWVDAVQKSGLKSIEMLYIDDRIFDQNFIHSSWPADQINNWYCAQVAGINYHLNVVHFFPSPNPGGRANLGLYAPSMPWMSIGNKTSSKTGKKDSSSFWVSRTPNSNSMTARGNVNATHTKPVKVAFHDPSMFFGNSLASELRKNGIAIGSVERVPLSAPMSKGDVLFVRKTPISSALLRSNRDSHNLYAETLLKRLSASATKRPGSFEDGASTIETAVAQRLGGIHHGLTVADGSGMSRENQTTTRTLARWLSSFKLDEPAGEALVKSLATPGNGTLESRFKSAKLDGATIHAKSGYLRGVCSLSGYILFDSGKAPFVFSIIVNDIKGTVRGAKKMQEQIIEALILEFGDGSDPQRLSGTSYDFTQIH